MMRPKFIALAETPMRPIEAGCSSWSILCTGRGRRPGAGAPNSQRAAPAASASPSDTGSSSRLRITSGSLAENAAASASNRSKQALSGASSSVRPPLFAFASSRCQASVRRKRSRKSSASVNSTAAHTVARSLRKLPASSSASGPPTPAQRTMPNSRVLRRLMRRSAAGAAPLTSCTPRPCKSVPSSAALSVSRPSAAAWRRRVVARVCMAGMGGARRRWGIGADDSRKDATKN